MSLPLVPLHDRPIQCPESTRPTAPHRRRRSRFFLALFLSSAAVGLSAIDTAPPQPTAIDPTRPTLLVILVVDQMRADMVERYGFQWHAGLRRLIREGAWFSEAAYPYLHTVTCPGHATIGTGTFPRTHGIIMNEWWDQTADRLVSCTEDASASLVTYGRPVTGGESPRFLRVPTLADELRAQLPSRSRIVTLSLKARSAIMLAGHRGDAVTWFDEEGAWVTSSAYATTPVPFVQAAVDAYQVEQDRDAVWERTLPPDAYLFEDAGTGERPPRGWTTTFPHPLAGDEWTTDQDFYYRWERSPWSDEYLERLAEAGVEALQLGRGPGIDFLGVSFSALDRVGHRFGPQSHEVQDLLIRLDVTVGRLLEHLDRAVGRGRYVVALTSDHGVAPIPERVLESNLAAGRLRPAAVASQLEALLGERLGPGRYVARMQYTDLYLMPGVYDRVTADRPLLEAVIGTLRSVPGVRRVLTRDEVSSLAAGTDAESRAAAQSHVPDRGGDLVIVPEPYFIMSSDATTHGTTNLYDRRVPLVLFGAPFRAGRYEVPATPADIAPTFARLAGITLSTPDGRLLAEAFATPGPPPADAPSR